MPALVAKDARSRVRVARAALRAAAAQAPGAASKAYRDALLSLSRAMADPALLGRVADALRNRDAAGAAQAVLSFAGARAESQLRNVVAGAFDDAAGRTLSGLVHNAEWFSIGNPLAAEAMDRLNVEWIAPTMKDAEDSLRTLYTAGIESGMHPRDIAREARGMVGLTAYDRDIISSYRQQLHDDPATALTRGLRDKRFDGTVRAALDGAPLSADAIDKHVARYAEKLLNWRSETWARTSTLNAMREGNLAGWQEFAAQSGVPELLEKKWIATMDGRERPEHAEMHAMDVWVPADEPFPYPGEPMTPGEGEYNCRCAMIFRVRPPDEAPAPASVAPELTSAPAGVSAAQPVDDFIVQPAPPLAPVVEDVPLPSLEPAIRGVDGFDRLVDAGYKYDQMSQSGLLDPLERSALSGYMGPDYKPINSFLRKGPVEPTDVFEARQFSRTQDRIRYLDSAFEKAKPLPADAELLRGGSFSDDLLHVGTVYSDAGFVSTTTDPINAHYFFNNYASSRPGRLRTVFRVRAPRGTKAIALSTDEHEVLLNRGTRFRITRVERVPTGVRKDIGGADFHHTQPWNLVDVEVVK